MNLYLKGLKASQSAIYDDKHKLKVQISNQNFLQFSDEFGQRQESLGYSARTLTSHPNLGKLTGSCFTHFYEVLFYQALRLFVKLDEFS